MRLTTGNIWDWHGTHDVVIPTNQGWRQDGTNVMGAGLALQAARRFPGLPAWYGAWCRQYGPAAGVVRHPDWRLICFPTKPLDSAHPWLSWQQGASIDLVARGAAELGTISGEIALPLVGCGLGGLEVDDVLAMLEAHLVEDRFVLVTQE
jgi:hypothetical protein